VAIAQVDENLLKKGPLLLRRDVLQGLGKIHTATCPNCGLKNSEAPHFFEFFHKEPGDKAGVSLRLEAWVCSLCADELRNAQKLVKVAGVGAGILGLLGFTLVNLAHFGVALAIMTVGAVMVAAQQGMGPKMLECERIDLLEVRLRGRATWRAVLEKEIPELLADRIR
jgi:hypothetical protein